MKDDGILSDEELARLKRVYANPVDWDYPLDEAAQTICDLIARLELAEKSLALAKSYGRGNPYLEAPDVAFERDLALKCLSEAPKCHVEECEFRNSPAPDTNERCTRIHASVDEVAYHAWYNSPTRQNLLKGVK